MSLAGLLGLFTQSNAIAEGVIKTINETVDKTSDSNLDDAKKTIGKAVDKNSNLSSNQEEDTKQVKNTEDLEDGVKDDASTQVMTEKEVEVTPQPEILGGSVNVYSLRGYNNIDSESDTFPNRRNMVVDGGITVMFDDQPPMVPHNIDKDRISLSENTCLKCHSKAASKLEMGPKPTSSHFRGRDGKQQKVLVAGRYFCTQCHTPQAHTKPLIKNNFSN
jgi:cytochrome c-type protein NapB